MFENTDLKMSITEVRDEVDKDGLDYALLEYCDPEDIEDKELQELWRLGQYILNQINKRLGVK